MPNKHCECELAGFCTRHQIEKSDAQVKLCRGEADRPDCGYKFWAAWEEGKFGAVTQAAPILDEWECENQASPAQSRKQAGGTRAKATTRRRYLGDHVEQALSLVGITKERVTAVLGDCGCCGRQAKLNELDQAAREILGGAVEAGREKLGKLLDFIHQD